ncbi:MAG: hypothetical protein K1X75_14340 [Leptospirales bacterium]|nr:hypothetical protein [Leptospirales bacterium]
MRAMAEGAAKVAAVPTPSAEPATPACPATVIVSPVYLFTRRISWLLLSAT